MSEILDFLVSAHWSLWAIVAVIAWLGFRFWQDDVDTKAFVAALLYESNRYSSNFHVQDKWKHWRNLLDWTRRALESGNYHWFNWHRRRIVESFQVLVAYCDGYEKWTELTDERVVNYFSHPDHPEAAFDQVQNQPYFLMGQIRVYADRYIPPPK